MRSALFAALVFCTTQGTWSFAAGLRFEKAGEHCYYLQPASGRPNVAAVATEEGILMVDPPSESSQAAAVADALKSTASKRPVRWIVFSDPQYVLTSGARYFAERGAVFLASRRLHMLSVAAMDNGSKKPAAPAGAARNAASGKPPGFAWFIFSGPMRLFPSDLEIRILALQDRVRAEGDVFVFVPAEKVLFAGRLYEPGRYPEIDPVSEGAAAGWIDGLKQVIDSVPVLKSAIPAAKPAPKTEPEKTPEEMIGVIPAFGRASNLKEMKDLLEASQKLRAEISRTVRAGRSCAGFLASPAAANFRTYENLDSYACRLFDDLTAEMKRKKSSAPQ